MAKRIKLQTGDPAPAGTGLDIDGQEQNLADYWSQGPVLLTFLRHFG